MSQDDKMKNLDSLNQDQVEDLLHAQGNKLGFLIAKSTLSDDVKIELVSLLGKMKIEDLERLLNIFEAKFVDYSSKEIDDMFKFEIKGVVDSYLDEQKKMADELIVQVNNIE